MAEGKQRDVAEEALVAVVVVHVADGVDMHHQGHEGNGRNHHRRQVIDQKADFQADALDHHPGVNRAVVRLRAVENVMAQHHQRQQKGHRHADDGDPMSAGTPDLAAEQASDKRAEQRRKRESRDRRFAYRLTLEHIEVGDVDGTPVTEQHDQE
jgi:hypothetical protein